MSIKADMPYCSAFIEEVTRYRTLIPMGIFHKTTEEVTLNGYRIAKDTTVRHAQVQIGLYNVCVTFIIRDFAGRVLASQFVCGGNIAAMFCWIKCHGPHLTELAFSLA